MQPLHHHLFGAVLCVFLPTMLRDDEFDDAALALGSAAGADCDSDGMLFPTVAILVLVLLLASTLLEIVYLMVCNCVLRERWCEC